MRPNYLAKDETPTEPVIEHALKTWCMDKMPDAVILLQPTSPLRAKDSLAKAIKLFEENDADSLMSVTLSHSFFWRNPGNPTPTYDYEKRPRRQDIKPSDYLYRENGSIYITKTNFYLERNNRLGGKIVMFEQPENESYEIDTEIDFMFLECLASDFAGAK